jgi:hypothetical protein
MAGTNYPFSNDLLAMILTASPGAAPGNKLFQNASAPYATLYLSLHTADPGSSANQTSNEAAYTSYARVAISRVGASWTFGVGVVNLTAPATFPTATGGSETEHYAGIGTDITGAGNLLWSGAITPAIVVSTGVAPQLTTLSTVTVA